MTQRKFSDQKGAATGTGIALTLLAILLIIGLVWWWMAPSAANQQANVYDTASTTAVTTATSTYTYQISTSTSPSATYPAIPNTGTSYSSNSTQTKVPYTTYSQQTQRRVSNTSNVSNAYSGYTTTSTRYHNSTYGLTLFFPADWAGYTYYTTPGGPANLPGTLTIHFVAPGDASDTFDVYVYSKEQWNFIRTQENYAHLNANDLGEGEYVGENFTWIYSANVYSRQAEVQNVLNTAVFY